MTQTFLITLDANKSSPHIGGKAKQIQQLLAKGIRVPGTYVCVWDAYKAQLKNKNKVIDTLRSDLLQTLDFSKAYAVRSSTNVEDGILYSFAGQFDTCLNVRGIDDILQAIQHVWQSTQKLDLHAYVNKTTISPSELNMAVIVQEMIKPVISGVAFSRNPMTGLNEIVVEAVKGSGENLVKGVVTPDRWIYKWGDWVNRPSITEIDEAVITDVVTQTKKISKIFGRPVDLEWVFDGTAVYWIQLREITTLKHLNVYSNRMSRELLPGLIKPLVWSVNIDIVNGAWIDIFTQLIGPNDIEPADLAKAFHYRAYFNMGTVGRLFEALGMPKDTLELLLGLEGGDERPTFRPSRKVLRHLPRMLKFALTKMWYGHYLESFLPEIDRTFNAFSQTPLGNLGEKELLTEIEKLSTFTKKAACANINGPLLMQLYNGMFKHRLKQHGIPYDQFDLTYKLVEIEKYDPTIHLDRLHQAFYLLDESIQEKIRKSDYEAFQRIEGLSNFQTAVSRFIEQFGHLSDSGNDFSQQPWRENPDLVLRMIISYRETAGSSNFQRPNEYQVKYTWQTLPLNRFNRWRLKWIYQKARQYRLYREAISFKYTYGYGLFRNYMLALADRFVQRGILEEREDIFYLYQSELRAIVQENADSDIKAQIDKRKEAIESAKDLMLPEIIYGDKAPPLETYDDNLERLCGIPTSGGYCKGSVRVIQSINEFDKMIPGCVLVIPYSDVSWAPLFANAGAIIAESGGILSHSSIVAREYRLPAVVSVPGACHILRDEMVVMVDGFKGEILIK